ncbi:SipW-dependent-type signal peptide-containing protein [Microtetraspora sp. NBRC 13810]|uniref:SipW-dependent-type signal peptide-containing protein n=1 Tax=Microtetraspora sp. NBRC 13810 TaxID=3030990 RepID=UPI00331DE44C
MTAAVAVRALLAGCDTFQVIVAVALAAGVAAGGTSSIWNDTVWVGPPPPTPSVASASVQVYVTVEGTAMAGRAPKTRPPPTTPRAAVFRATRRRAFDICTVQLRFHAA